MGNDRAPRELLRSAHTYWAKTSAYILEGLRIRHAHDDEEGKLRQHSGKPARLVR
ncbi:hypothetical protein ACFPRL_23590 [Pseudoclavibacter helvolus]